MHKNKGKPRSGTNMKYTPEFKVAVVKELRHNADFNYCFVKICGKLLTRSTLFTY